MATSWAEARREAMFKRVEGGFIFRVPGLVPRHYMVTEAQKSEIYRLMRTQSFTWLARRRSKKRIGLVLEGARHTEQRITLRERNETYARLLPLSKLLAAGVAGALLSAFFASQLFNFYGQLQLTRVCYGRLCLSLVSPMNPPALAWVSLVVFSLLAVRFFYLAILKLSLEPSA
jgi:hypothetical protein